MTDNGTNWIQEIFEKDKSNISVSSDRVTCDRPEDQLEPFHVCGETRCVG
jgi:hypothetical protein